MTDGFTTTQPEQQPCTAAHPRAAHDWGRPAKGELHPDAEVVGLVLGQQKRCPHCKLSWAEFYTDALASAPEPEDPGAVVVEEGAADVRCEGVMDLNASSHSPLDRAQWRYNEMTDTFVYFFGDDDVD